MNTTTKQTATIIVNMFFLTQITGIKASHTSSLQTATPCQQLMQAQLVQFTQSQAKTVLRQRATSDTYESKGPTCSLRNQSSLATYNQSITAPPSPNPETQESSNSDLCYIENKHPTNLEHPVFETLYAQLDTFPRELISIIISYCRMDISKLSSNEQMVEAQNLSNAHTNEIIALIPLSATKFASASKEGTIKLWELKGGTWACAATMKDQKTTLTALTALADDWLLSGAANGEITAWYLVDNKPKHTLQSSTNKNRIRSLVALSEDSFAAGSQRTATVLPIITIWRKVYHQEGGSNSWEPTQTVSVPYTPQFLVNIDLKKQHYFACGFSSGTLNIYQDCKQKITLETTYNPPTPSELYALIYNKNSNHLIAATVGSIIIFEAPNLLPRQTNSIPWSDYAITTCTLHPNNQLIVALRHSYNISHIFCMPDSGILQETPWKEISNEVYPKESIQHLIPIAHKQLALVQEHDITILEHPVTSHYQHKACVIQ